MGNQKFLRGWDSMFCTYILSDVRRLGTAQTGEGISARTDILHFAKSNHEFYKDTQFICAYLS
jgi:hypothetical protein